MSIILILDGETHELPDTLRNRALAERLLLPEPVLDEKLLLMDVYKLPWSTRARNCCLNEGLEFLFQVLESDPVTLGKAKNLGKKTLRQIRSWCKEYVGLDLDHRFEPEIRESLLKQAPKCRREFRAYSAHNLWGPLPPDLA